MTNKIISILTNENEIAFVFDSEDIDMWYWIVDETDIRDYKGTINDFINDEQNETIGVSVASFDTYDELIEDLNSGYDKEWYDMEDVLADAIESTNDLDELGKLITKADTFGYYGLGDMAFEKINNIKQANGIED